VNVAYWWTYSFVRWLVYGIVIAGVAVLMFVGASSAVISRRLRKAHGSDRLTVARLNALSKSRGGK
jgi:hypothetical protein